MAYRASSGIKDTVQLTIKHCLTNLLFSLFSSFFVLLSFCPFVLYCFTSAVSSTPSNSRVSRYSSSAYCRSQKTTQKGFSFTYCMVLVRLAAPQVADHSLQSLHSHCTVLHVHIFLLVSFSGGWVQVCGRPEQSGCCTTI